MTKMMDLREMNADYEKFVIVERFPEIDYVLLRRDTNFQPWIAAWAYNEEDEHWGQGHYFEEFIDAVRYIDSKLRKIPYDRMNEIASRLVDYAKESDDDIEDILSDYDIDLDEKEKEWFGIYDNEDEEEEWL